MKEIHFTQIDSTNRYLKDNYASVDDLTFVRADHQTAGKGRNQRIWQSEPGENLLFSLLIKDPDYFPLYRSISIITALSIAQVLKKQGIEAMIKWPNDVYVEGRKICGILLESVTRKSMECLIIGVGLNVNQCHFGDELIHPAVSMKLTCGRDFSITEVRDECYEQLLDNLEALKNGHDFYPEVTGLDYLKGKTVYYDSAEYQVEGINRSYSLRLSANGQSRDVEAGEISFHHLKGA